MGGYMVRDERRCILNPNIKSRKMLAAYIEHIIDMKFETEGKYEITISITKK